MELGIFKILLGCLGLLGVGGFGLDEVRLAGVLGLDFAFGATWCILVV